VLLVGVQVELHNVAGAAVDRGVALILALRQTLNAVSSLEPGDAVIEHWRLASPCLLPRLNLQAAWEKSASNRHVVTVRQERLNSNMVKAAAR